ncbi:hypothetical protein BYT27DRAFT_7160291 [Phlegmacium glaucopus]|nr:hypothetical protein BYT27DRAFT_7160291 [Phlegmacium glaucopus]
MAESSPLLDDSNGNLDDNFEAQTNVPVGNRFKRLIQNLIIINLILSAITVPSLIANYLIIKFAPFGFYTWGAQNSSKQLAMFMSVSLVFSIINVLVDFPILLNLIVDIVLTASVFPRVFSLLDTLPNSAWCQIQIGYPNPGENLPHPKCKDWKSVVTILMGIAAAFGGIVGVIYVALLVLRSVAILRTKFWKRPLTFSAGQTSFEISMSSLRQESATTENIQDVRQGVEAGGHGPLYLS